MQIRSRSNKRIITGRCWAINRRGRILFAAFVIVFYTISGSKISFAENTALHRIGDTLSDQVDRIADYRNFIEQSESERGPYDQSLSEPLISLGLALKMNGEYFEAKNVFTRAMHVIRVNQGLYNLNQMPLFELLIDNDVARKDWHGVNKTYHHMYWVYRHAYDEVDPRLLKLIDNNIAWHYAAVNLTKGAYSAGHLLKSRELIKQALEIVASNYGSTHPEYAKWLYKQAVADYYTAVAIRRGGDMGLVILDSLAFDQLKYGFEQSSDWLVKKIYRKGMMNFRKIYSIYNELAGASPEMIAMVLIYRADWNMLFNKHTHASDIYREAVSMLVQGGIADDSINSYFSLPVVLPMEKFSPDFDEKLQPGKGLYGLNTVPGQQEGGISVYEGIPPYIAWSYSLPGVRIPVQAKLDINHRNNDNRATAVFDVEETGWAENIKITEHNPAYRASRSRAYETIWSMQFRPKIENGNVRQTAGLSMQFVLPD